MKIGTVNPLLLLIMTQAWCHVKRSNSTHITNYIKTYEDEDDIISVANNSFKEDEKNINSIFTKGSLSQVWEHPFFDASHNSNPLSIKQLVNFWGECNYSKKDIDLAEDLEHLDTNSIKKSKDKQTKDKQTIDIESNTNNLPTDNTLLSNDDFWIISTREDFECCKNHFDKSPRAIKLLWRKSWSKNIPNWVYQIIDYKDKNNVQLWMNVLPLDDLWLSVDDEATKKSIQLGWSWWLTPPQEIERFEKYFASFKKNYKFWFTSQLSDQWVWPWCDMLTKNILENIVLFPQERYWLKDIKLKSTWLKLDEELALEMEFLLGDSTSLKSLVLSTFAQLEKIDFLDRPFDD